MATVLVIAGHGVRRNGSFDPGALGIVGGEHKYMVNKLFPAMKKYAPSNFVFYSKRNVYSYGDIVRLAKGYGSNTVVVEVHYDAGARSAKGGHVIIHSSFKPDAMDLRLRNAINSMVGVRYSHRGYSGISGRNNLANVNRTASGGVNYRMLELGFGTNPTDAKVMLEQTDAYAKKLVEAITGKSVSKPTPTVGWVKNTTGWWYRNTDGSYPKDQWLKVKGVWYLFDNRGYMLTGWQQVDDTWYYLHTNGAMRTGWLQLGTDWYYLHTNGAMRRYWFKPKADGPWFYANGSGRMQTGWILSANSWYYLNESGHMQTGLITVNGSHFMLQEDGSLVENDVVKLQASSGGYLR